MAFCKTQDWAQSQAPYWMRRLEEKYQRLHAKIISQAGRFTHRRSSTTRILRESQLKHKVNTAQEGLGNDQELLSVETSAPTVQETGEQGEINKAIIRSHYVSQVSRAKTAKFLSRCVSKQNSGDHSINPRAQTRRETRSSGLDNNVRGQSEGNSYSPCKDTPISSGVVTRVSSAYPFTRLSSSTDLYRPSPRNVSRLEQTGQEDHALELNLALHHRLENQENETSDENNNNEDDFGRSLCFGFPENGYDSAVSYEDQGCDAMNVRCHTDREDLAGRGRRRRRAVTRPVKTSVSRISHKTSKSCPATLTGVLDNNKGSFDWNIHSKLDECNNNNISSVNNSIEVNRRGNILTSNVALPVKSSASLEPLPSQGLQTGRMRVFARMSSEARHAIDETLKEMKMEEEMQVARPEADVEDIPSCVEEESNNNVNTSADSIRNNVSMKTGEEPSVDQRLNLFNDRVTGSNQHGDLISSDASVISSDSHIYAMVKDKVVLGNSKSFISRNNSRTRSNHLVGGSSRDYNNNNNNSILGSSLDSKLNPTRKLPQLEENVAFQEKFPNPHAPLPAIKRINMAAPFRETTFEITPPDFDIRFREIITCQKGDRETPPLDVRQQSIDKCEQWLIRYTPRR